MFYEQLSKLILIQKWVDTHSEKIGKYWYWIDWQIQRQIGNATRDDWWVEIAGPELCPEVLSCKQGVRNPTLHTSRYSYHVFWRDEVYLLFWGRSVRYGEYTISKKWGKDAYENTGRRSQVRRERSVKWRKGSKYRSRVTTSYSARTGRVWQK